MTAIRRLLRRVRLPSGTVLRRGRFSQPRMAFYHSITREQMPTAPDYTWCIIIEDHYVPDAYFLACRSCYYPEIAPIVARMARIEYFEDDGEVVFVGVHAHSADEAGELTGRLRSYARNRAT